MAEIIDQSYFTELAAADPTTICRKGRCSYLFDQRQFALQIWGAQFLIDPGKRKIEHRVASGSPFHQYFDVFIIYYLLRAQDISLSGEWISEKDLPGGPTFFRGPHQIPTDLITQRFDNDILEFKSCCARLGGSPLDMADAAFCFSLTPDIPVAVLYWRGDEDFPAEAKLLFDRSMTELLSLDVVFALAVGVCAKIGGGV
jgi:Domain of unknown function (DUF3786)